MLRGLFLLFPDPSWMKRRVPRRPHARAGRQAGHRQGLSRLAGGPRRMGCLGNPIDGPRLAGARTRAS